MPAYSSMAFAEESNGDMDAHEIHMLEELDGEALSDGINVVDADGQLNDKSRSNAIGQSDGAEDSAPDNASNRLEESDGSVDLDDTAGTVGIAYDDSVESGDADVPSNETEGAVGNKSDAGGFR